jgi:hypothetical protein
MVLKRLEELTAVELRTELKRAGIKGKYIKAQAIMRLTTHLIDISEDPLTFEFDPEMPIDEVQVDGNPDDYEVTNDVPEILSSEPAGSTAASVSGLVNSISAGNSANMPPVTLPQSPTALVTTTSSASITTATVTSSSASASYPFQNMGHFPPVSNMNMHHPYNPSPVMYPGMAGTDYFSQYKAMAANPWPQMLPGMSPTGPIPPYPQMLPGMSPTGPMPPYGSMWGDHGADGLLQVWLHQAWLQQHLQQQLHQGDRVHLQVCLQVLLLL